MIHVGRIPLVDYDGNISLISLPQHLDVINCMTKVWSFFPVVPKVKLVN